MATRQRRSLWSDIYQSSKVNKLSIPATLLYTWAIANFDDYGFQEGDPRLIKGLMFPKRDDMTIEKIESLIEEILSIEDDPPLWRVYCIGQESFIQDPVWFHRQTFHGIHKKPSKILKLLTEHQIDTGLTPDLVLEGCKFGVLSEGEVKDKDKDKDKVFKSISVTPDALKKAQLLLNEIQKWHPRFKPPSTLNGWAKSIDEMMRLDKRMPEEIEETIKWCQKDTFWRKNILSGTTLRLKFNRLQAEQLSSGKGKIIHAGVNALDKKMQEAFSRAKAKRIEHKS